VQEKMKFVCWGPAGSQRLLSATVEHSNVRSGKLGPLACSDQKELVPSPVESFSLSQFQPINHQHNPLHSAISYQSVLPIRLSPCLRRTPQIRRALWGCRYVNHLAFKCIKLEKGELERSPGGRVADVETSRPGLRPSYIRMLPNHWLMDSMNSG